MTTEMERRVGNLLDRSNSRVGAPENRSSEARAQRGKQSSDDGDVAQPVSTPEIDSKKEKLSFELKEKQDKMKVQIQCCYINFTCYYSSCKYFCYLMSSVEYAKFISTFFGYFLYRQVIV